MKAILVDDEASGRNALKMLLEMHCPEVKVERLCGSVSQAILDIAATSPDIVFLDIEMPHENGFDLLRSLPSISFEVVFVTAYNKYAIQAIRFNALDYLLKPVQAEELVLAIGRAKQKQRLNFGNTRFEQFLRQQSNPFEKIAVPLRDGFLFLDVSEIIRCEADSNYCHFFLNGGEKITSSKTLAYFEEILPGSSGAFIRVHHSHLVNINFVKNYAKGEGGMLTLSDGTEIPVSRRKKENLLAALKI